MHITFPVLLPSTYAMLAEPIDFSSGIISRIAGASMLIFVIYPMLDCSDWLCTFSDALRFIVPLVLTSLCIYWMTSLAICHIGTLA
ncbi:MAG: hypothetical protein Q8K75_06665 [Chlamydiales bacterium]|nr:hypothetical protein [Chlamydiales bacterium]